MELSVVVSSCQQVRACFLLSEVVRSVGFSRLGRCVPCCRVAGLPICFPAHADLLAARSVPLVATARSILKWCVCVSE